MTTQSGPGELLVIGLPNTSADQVIDAIASISTADVRVLDLVIVTKTAGGAIEIIEVEDLGDRVSWVDLELSGSGLTGQEDIDIVGSGLEEGSSALIVVLEHVWAAPFAARVAGSGGAIVASEWIPAVVINDLRATASE